MTGAAHTLPTSQIHNPKQPTLHLKRILVATDFSPRSKNALQYAANLAREYGAAIHLLHVTVPPAAVDKYLPSVKRATEFSDRALSTLAKDECLQGLCVEAELRAGHLAEAVADMVTQKNIDLIVVGTAGRYGLSRAAFGSVAEQIIRKSPVPVLAIGASRSSTPEPSTRSSIVCALRFPPNQEAIRYAWKLSLDRKAPLVFVHVVESLFATSYSFDKAMTESVMREAIMRAVSPAPIPKCEFVIEYDYGWAGILRAAEEYDAELIVVGARKLDSFVETSSHVAHTTVAAVLSRSTCPVIAIPGSKSGHCQPADFSTLKDEIC